MASLWARRGRALTPCSLFPCWRAGLWPCGTVYLPGPYGMLCSPAYAAGGRPLLGGGVSMSNGNEIPSPSLFPRGCPSTWSRPLCQASAPRGGDWVCLTRSGPGCGASVLRTLLLKHRCPGWRRQKEECCAGFRCLPGTQTLSVAVSSLLEYLKRRRELIPSPIRKYQLLESSFLHCKVRRMTDPPHVISHDLRPPGPLLLTCLPPLSLSAIPMMTRTVASLQVNWLQCELGPGNPATPSHGPGPVPGTPWLLTWGSQPHSGLPTLRPRRSSCFALTWAGDSKAFIGVDQEGWMLGAKLGMEKQEV